MTKNLMGKSRKEGNPYMTFTGPGGWEWKVLKAYQSPEREAANGDARWFLSTTSPYTHGSGELGDGYVRDVMKHGRLTFIDPELKAAGYEPVMPTELTTMEKMGY